MSETDFLDEDEKIRNQNYVCLSFLSPAEVLENKEAFYFSKFIESFSKEMNTLLDNLSEKFPVEKELLNTVKTSNKHIFDHKEMDEQYKFFKSNNYDEIEKDFHANNSFKTSIQGIKVRGVYDTIEQARKRCDVLKKKDTYFDIYVGEVGCWMPFSPNPTSIEDQEYGEEQLNTLMKKYKENKEAKDQIFDKRKIEAVKTSTTQEISDEINEKDDPWTESKKDDESNQTS